MKKMTDYKKEMPKRVTYLGWENDPPLSCEEYFGSLICLLETIKRDKTMPSAHLLDEIIHHLRRAWDLVPEEKNNSSVIGFGKDCQFCSNPMGDIEYYIYGSVKMYCSSECLDEDKRNK